MSLIQKKLVLASASPRRSEMLSSLGLEFIISPADIDESRIKSDSAAGLAELLALEKARSAALKYPSDVVMAADTVVAVQDSDSDIDKLTFLGKPKDAGEARSMLKQLSGRSHQVVTGFCLMAADEDKKVLSSVATEVVFCSLDAQLIDSYIETDEPFDKAGAYGIQGIGQVFIESIRGSYSNVVGLPLAEVSKELRAWGIWRPPMLQRSA